MITQENLKALLAHLRFTARKNTFIKAFGETLLQVDFEHKQILYPEDEGLVVNERQTCNFSQNENFVVFECVYRLLEKGYKPEHIELEPKWKLGRGASGGRADILVKDQEGNPLLLIECKTWGDEFEKEKQKMLNNGGQLFSYFQQERSTQYLCLYAADFEEDKIIYGNAIVKTLDRQEDIDEFDKGNESIKLYKNADNNKELFEVWKETFNRYFHYNGIFENDVNAYKIELKPLKRKDLKPFTEAPGVFNQFMEILRHNNISDNANAFNRILSLFLCKIVDEEKGKDQILDFQVKEGEDSPEKIQDRLQKLYAKGMKEHLGEDIVYFEDQSIQDIIEIYPQRENGIQTLKDIFKQIKYYTHNEFAIKEVHNKELFLQNARVLHEIIKMLQNFQFRYTKKQQMLGDFFELLLNHGVKQNEGQFFTPVPIVRFMILSLGLDKIAKRKIENGEKNFLPKILDYACGAGHFLTESIDELQHFIENLDINEITNLSLEESKSDQIIQNMKYYKETTKWAKEYIFGVEKDYRLVRTSQIACFINGDGDANIIFGDGLEDHNRLELKHKFDVILSNPPFSIKAFKNYLSVNEKQFSLFDSLTESSKEIENIFIERTTQLLKEKARAAVILPSSILSNDSALHEATRTMLLEHFHIKAMASFGGRTFGATGTNPVIVFLEKRNIAFAQDRRLFAEDLFRRKSETNSYLERPRLLKMFVEYRSLNIEDYITFMHRNADKNIQQQPFYKDYQNWFNRLTEINTLKKKEKFKELSEEEQKNKLEELFYDKVLKIEEKKFYHFMLTLQDDFRRKETIPLAYEHQKTIIVQSGEKQTEKTFLGYEFSDRKGSEGIKINRNSKKQAINKMYDDNNHLNPQKANSYILKHFENQNLTEIDPAIKEHIKIARLTDMLDFTRAEFSNSLSLNPQIRDETATKWSWVRLGEVAETIESGNRPKGGVQNINEGVHSLGGEHIHPQNGYLVLDNPRYIPLDFYENNERGRLQENDILICKDGALTGKVALLRKELTSKKAMVNEHIFIVRCSFLEKQKYIFNFLLSVQGQDLLKQNITGAAQGGLNSTNLKNLKIPLPPLEVQQKIVAECEAVDTQAQQADKTIKTCKNEIESEVQKIIHAGHEMKDLEKICEDIFAGGDVPKDNFSKTKTDTFKIPIVSNGIENKGLYGYTNQARVSKPSITISARGTIGHIELRREPFFPIVRLIVAIPNGNLIMIKYLSLLLEITNIKNSGGVIPQLTVPMVKQIQIPLPPLSIQNELVQKVEKLEQQINKAQHILDQASQYKQQILEIYLR